VSEHDQLQALLSSLPIILFALDRRANLSMLEGKGAKLFTPTPHALLGRPFVDLYHENSETPGLVANALEGNAVTWTEHLGHHLFQITLTPVRDREGSVTGLLGVGIESPGKTPTSRSPEKGHRTGSDSTSIGGKVFTQVSHELRSPLNSIVGFANLLLQNGESHFDEQDLSYLQRIMGNATHLLGVVGDMMDRAVLKSGTAKVVTSVVDLGGLIRETIAELGGSSKAPHVEVRTEIPADALSIETDRQKLKQILINLVANALKFTQEGSVTVRVGVDEFLRPARIDVQDTGMGIPEEYLETIFNAFERGNSPAGQEVEGTGLGLTISRGLCSLLGYSLRAASEPGRGSTFTIMLSQTPASQSR